ncbi:hypothetical protein GH714_009125 [Hevea brasiliensis]|uniref:Uncharacterized protein n=1 Tax=Hevea brasiliensis TaxID=3981 RepID=A0A6A6MTU6_HEVBR|nr:hypothetical protein GH714_009125 [Hevea brasiliensis]
MGFDPSEVRLNSLANRVLRCFGPGEFYVAITCHCSGVQGWAVECGDVDGCWCRMVVTQELESGSGCVVYRSYDKKEKGHVVVASPAKVGLLLGFYGSFHIVIDSLALCCEALRSTVGWQIRRWAPYGSPMPNHFPVRPNMVQVPALIWWFLHFPVLHMGLKGRA